MKFILMLFCCTLLALAIMTLPQHQAAEGAYGVSEDLADAMSSHGMDDAGPNAGTARLSAVAYRSEAGSR